jgi:hypothetical protein
MLKAQIAHVFRTGVRASRRAVQVLDPETGNFSNPAFAYRSLNAALADFMREAPHILRPSYTWGVLQGAHLARALGIERVSVIEFGVAGGNGLVAMELAGAKTEQLLGVKIDVHGFDTGEGLPKPTDYRDHPNNYTESTYMMDEGKLRARLRRATLHLGLVEHTIAKFLSSAPAPVAFVSFDLDYYSSTVDAFALLKADDARLLPRVHCYFDDIMGLTCSEFAGERLAINEFNAEQPARKISPIFGLKYFLPLDYARQQWAEMMYLAHSFRHARYGDADGLVVDAERPLGVLDR